MKTYKVPSHIDPDKLFLVNRSELEGRLDPNFYKPKYTNLVYQISKKECLKLKQIVKFSNETWNQIDFFENQFPYIEIGEVNLETGYINSIKEIPISGAPSRAKMVARAYDILISTTRPTRGAVSYLKDIGKINIASTGFSIIRNIKKEIILREYLFYVLRLPILLEQMGQRSSGGNYPAITQEELGNIIIPLPPLEIQQQIVDYYQKAYQQKQQKEAEAQALLESIDTYLLTELGIALPEKDNSLQNRIFTTMLSEISGGRLDPKLYDTNTTRLKRSLYNTDENRFIKSPLKKLIVQSISGDWGSEKVDDFDKQKYKKCLVIRATEFDNDYNLNLINPRIKFRLIKNEKLKKIDIQENDLLIEKSGGSPDQPVGRIAILDNKIINENIICYSNFIHKIRINEKLINPKYLFSYLKTIYNIKLTESMQSQTNGIRNLIMSNYFNQTILIPKNQDNSVNFEKQNEIAEHIQQLRSRAKHLQEEAKNILEQAKQEVEKMILGE